MISITDFLEDNRVDKYKSPFTPRAVQELLGIEPSRVTVDDDGWYHWVFELPQYELDMSLNTLDLEVWLHKYPYAADVLKEGIVEAADTKSYISGVQIDA